MQCLPPFHLHACFLGLYYHAVICSPCYRGQPKAGTGYKMLSVPFVFSMSRFQGPAFRCDKIVVIVTLVRCIAGSVELMFAILRILRKARGNVPWVPEDIFFLSILMVGSEAALTRKKIIIVIFFLVNAASPPTISIDKKKYPLEPRVEGNGEYSMFRKTYLRATTYE